MERTSKPTIVWYLVAGIIVLSVLTGGLIAWVISSTNPGRQLEQWTHDSLLRHRETHPPSSSIRLVGLTDEDCSYYEKYPISRSNHANIAQILGASEVRQMTFDYLFNLASFDEKGDGRLVDVFSEVPNLTLAYYFGEADGSLKDAPPTFLTGSRFGVDLAKSNLPESGVPHPPFEPMEVSYGAANAPVSSHDGVIRKIPLFLRDKEKLYPGLAMQSLIKGFNVSEDQIRIVPGEFVEIVATPSGTLRIPIDEQARMTINFHCLLEDFFPAYSYTDLEHAIKEGDVEQWDEISGDLADKFVMVGDVSTGSSDIVTTPLGRMPGVAVQALALGNILEGNYLQFWSRWQTILLCILIAFVCYLVLGRTRRLWIFPLFLAILVAGYLAWAMGRARSDVLVPIAAPIATIGISSLVVLGGFVLIERRSRRRMKASVRPYIAAPLYDRLLQSANEELIVSERRELTIFFSDIRGFTEWTEGCEAEEISEVLNQYFSRVIPIVEQFGGTLDKLMGDGMMVFFGAPDAIDDHAASAIRMAVRMQEKISELQEEWKQEARVPLGVGMAVHTGYVTVGNFGSPEFSDYTVIGANVNVTARIESEAPEGTILITDRARACAGNAVATEAFKDLQLKGIANPLPVYKVTGVSEFSVPQFLIGSLSRSGQSPEEFPRHRR